MRKQKHTSDMQLAALSAEAAALYAAGLCSAADQAARGWGRLAARARRPGEVLRATNFLVRIALDRQEPRLALRYGEEAVASVVGSAAPEPAERARLHLQLAKAAWRIGWVHRTEAYSDAADVCALEAPLPLRLIGHGALVRGVLAVERGRWATAETETARARELALECADRPLEFAAENNLGWLARQQGDLDCAQERLQRLCAQSAGAMRGRVLVELAGIALDRQEVGLAQAWVQEALHAFGAAPSRLDELDLAPLYGLMGRLAMATGHAGQAQRLFRYGAQWYQLTGRVALATGLAEAARRCHAASVPRLRGDDVPQYLAELVNVTVVYGGRTAPEHHLRRVALLAARFGARAASHPEVMEHAALLHELPVEGRWFCRLCDEGRRADQILSAAGGPDRLLLDALDQYETALACRQGWRRAMEGIGRLLSSLGHPAAGPFQLAHAPAGG